MRYLNRVVLSVVISTIMFASIGCASHPTPQQERLAAPVSPSAAGTPSATASARTGIARLFGEVSFTAPPRNVFDPVEAKEPPRYEADPFAWNPHELFDKWLNEMQAGTMALPASFHEAEGLYSSLKGATVADVGAGCGNNLLMWRELLGPEGRLVETEVDPNAARFMAFAANRIGYADRTVVINNTFLDPCLPIGQFDLVLCSQVHSHITVARDPGTEATFRKESRAFLAAVRRALKNDSSLFVVIEGRWQHTPQGGNSDPRRYVLDEARAIASIEANGFKMVKGKRNKNVWAAAFSRR